MVRIAPAEPGATNGPSPKTPKNDDGGHAIRFFSFCRIPMDIPGGLIDIFIY